MKEMLLENLHLKQDKLLSFNIKSHAKHKLQLLFQNLIH